MVKVLVHLSEDLFERDKANASLVSNLILEVQVDLLNSNVLVHTEIRHISYF